MKILLVNTFDTRGGPGGWTYSMHRNFLSAGVESWYLVDQKFSQDTHVVGSKGTWGALRSRIKQIVDYLPLLLYPHWKRVIFSTGWAPFGIDWALKKYKPDIVHFNWVNRGFVSVRSMDHIKIPIVWTLHDMWAFTGGCHYDETCGRYEHACGTCPLLGSHNSDDISAQTLRAKKMHWSGLDLHFVAPSNWLFECAKKSTLLRDKQIRRIPVSVDTSKFIPVDKESARKKLGLPLDKQLILFGAVNATRDKRKGFVHLLEALRLLASENKNKNCELVVFGSSDSGVLGQLPLITHFLGTITDAEKMSLAYSVADVFVAPSLQDNMPLTVLEALACNTPVVAFDIGGMPDMIEHKKNGYLAQPFSPMDFALGVQWVLSQEAKDSRCTKNYRQKIVQEFDASLIAQKYLSLYTEILGNSSPETGV